MQPTTNSGGDPVIASVTRSQAFADVVLALVLTVAGAVVAPLVGQQLIPGLGLPLLAVMVLQGLIILAGLQVLLVWRGQSWRHIGFRPIIRLKDAGRGLLALLLVFVVNAALSFIGARLAPELLEEHQQRLSAFAGMLTGDLPLSAIGAAMLFTGFYEEALARGFLLTRCRTLLTGSWGPVLLSSVLFGLGHFYQGGLGVVQTALVGVVFAGLALHWGTLWPLILAHAALNTLSLTVLRALDATA
jgi:membrane protease YdiL (CAAX protease family)